MEKCKFYDELASLPLPERDKRREEILGDYRVFYYENHKRLELTIKNFLGFSKRSVEFSLYKNDGWNFECMFNTGKINVLWINEDCLVPSDYYPISYLSGGNIYLDKTKIPNSGFWGVVVLRKENKMEGYSYILKMGYFHKEDEKMDKQRGKNNGKN